MRSGNVELVFGIAQGSVLGPIMFVSSTNSVTHSLKDIQIFMYADVIGVLFKNKSASNMEIDRFVQLTNL